MPFHDVAGLGVGSGTLEIIKVWSGPLYLLPAWISRSSQTGFLFLIITGHWNQQGRKPEEGTW